MQNMERMQSQLGLEVSPEVEADLESPFTEAEEMELATELLSITSEAELDQFLGKLFKGAWRGIKKVGKTFGKVLRPLGGALKGIAKKALPWIAGAAGTFFGGPAGGALGSKLGSLVSRALEAELEEFAAEDRELEMARRFVRLAGTAARRAALSPPTLNPRATAMRATFGAARRHLPGVFSRKRPVQPAITRPLLGPAFIAPGGDLPTYTGRWIRRGPSVVILNCYGGAPSTGPIASQPSPPPEAPPDAQGDEGAEEFGGF